MMMKKLILSFLLLSGSMMTFAQTNAGNSSIFIGAGPSIPIGDFAATNASDERSGLATTGLQVELGYQYRFSEHIGAILMYQWKTFGISKDALRYSVPDGSGGSATTSATTWKMSNVLAGLVQLFPLSPSGRFSIMLREAAGVQFTSTPESSLNYSIPGFGNGVIKHESQSTTSFAYLAGLGFHYQLTNSIGVKLYGDFSNSKATFNAHTVSNGSSSTTFPESKQETGTIAVGLGLTIGL